MNLLRTLALVAMVAFATTGCAKKPVQTPPAPPVETPVPTPAPTPTPPPVVTPPSTPTTGLPIDKATLGKLQVVYFALDSDAIDEGAQAALDGNVRVLKSTTGDFVVEGHCDDRGTAEYNQSLGERRAKAVQQYFADQGIALSRMSVVSYGKDRPAVEGSDEHAWSKNRRAEFSLPK
ncbi:MAG: OmpA family protein [Candidatus Eisenbacteria bacterium]